jgi:hypothetical protein
MTKFDLVLNTIASKTLGLDLLGRPSREHLAAPAHVGLWH